MLLVDLSGSMDTKDFTNSRGETVDRLAAVKEVLDDFLTRREGDRVGLIVFGNAAFVQVPFTQDLQACRILLQETAVGMAGPRTAFGDAVGLGITLFEQSDVMDRVMIALTDGNDTASRVPPPQAARIASDNDITLHVVGVGDPSAASEEKLDEAVLREVSATTGGRYFHASDRQQLQDIIRGTGKNRRAGRGNRKPPAPKGAVSLASGPFHAAGIGPSRRFVDQADLWCREVCRWLIFIFCAPFG